MDSNIIGSNREITNKITRENAMRMGMESQILNKQSLRKFNMSFRILPKDLKHSFDFTCLAPNEPIRYLHCSRLQSLGAWVPAGFAPR